MRRMPRLSRKHGCAVVTVAPPEPRVEVVGIAPPTGYVWFPGYWNWNAAPMSGWAATGARLGYNWAPHAWVHYGGGWRMAPGHWVRR